MIRARSLDKHVCISSDNAQVAEYFRTSTIPHAQIPNYGLSEDCGKFDWTVVHEQRGQSGIAYNLSDREIRINGRFQVDTSEHDLTFLLLTLFSESHEQEGRTLLHASAVMHNGKADVFVGARGGGKSILASLLNSRYDLPILSSENVIIEGPRFIAGTAYVYNRIPCLNSFLPQMIDDTDREHLNDYEKKKQYPARVLPITNPVPLGNVYLLNLELSDYFVAREPHISTASYELLKNASDYVSGHGRTILNFRRPHPNLERSELRERRTESINEIIAGGVVLLTGNPVKAAEHVMSL